MHLFDGFEFIPMLIGMLALSEVFIVERLTRRSACPIPEGEIPP